jgi:hypothetical protein
MYIPHAADHIFPVDGLAHSLLDIMFHVIPVLPGLQLEGTWWSWIKTLECHSGGSALNPWSDLCVKFCAHRLKPLPLPKILVWGCEIYQAPVKVHGLC